MTVGILGMAFKAESDDTRSSLSYKLKRILRFKAGAVLCTDPYVTTDPDLLPLDEVLERVRPARHRRAAPRVRRPRHRRAGRRHLEPARATACACDDAAAVSVVIPVYNEGDEHRRRASTGIFEAITLPCEVLVVFDSPDDTTRAVPREVRATTSRGSCRRSTPTARARPTRSASASTTPRADVVVVTMADGCDDPQQIDQLARLVERGVVVAAASPLHAAAASRSAGPSLKALLSRLAGLLAVLARPGRHPRRHQLVQGLLPRASCSEVGIESDAGFEIGIELVAKARRLRLPVAEIPTIWLDRTLRRVQLQDARPGCPRYLRWYLLRLRARRLDRRASSPSARKEHDMSKVLVTGSAGLHRRLRRRGAARPRATSVVGIDNFSKYGPVAKSYDDHPQLPLRRGRRPRRRAA